MTLHLAILGPEATDADVESFVASLRLNPEGRSSRHLPGQHDQSTHGKWSGGLISPQAGGVYHPAKGFVTTDDPTRMENLTPEHQAKILAQLDSQFPGMTEAKLVDNIDAAYRRADPQTQAEGKAWYGQAHDDAMEIKRLGFSEEQGVAAIAGMSPQNEWDSNSAGARYVARQIKADPVVHLRADLEVKARKELAGNGKDVTCIADAGPINGRRLSELHPRVAAAVLKGMAHQDELKTRTGKGCGFSCGVDGIEVSVRCLRGGSPADELGGHKVRSFYNNILRGSQSGGCVTIDTHAISAALGEKVTSKDPRMGAITRSPSSRSEGTKGTYAVFATAYRDVAAKYGLSPEQLQAIVWLQWRKEQG